MRKKHTGYLTAFIEASLDLFYCTFYTTCDLKRSVLQTATDVHFEPESRKAEQFFAKEPLASLRTMSIYL
jgi:hypothetical protein